MVNLSQAEFKESDDLITKHVFANIKSAVDQLRASTVGKNAVVIPDFYDDISVGHYGIASVSAQAGVFSIGSCAHSC